MKLKDWFMPYVIWVFFSPLYALVLTFMSPSVAESVIEDLGECNIWYKGVYYPCMTWKEAYILNIKLVIIIGLFLMVVVLLGSRIVEIIKKKESV